MSITLCYYCIVDSEATSHHWCEEDKKALYNLENNDKSTVNLHNGQQIQSSEEDFINLSDKINKEYTKTTILPNLKSSSQISLGKLCGDNCKVELNKQAMLVTKNEECIVKKIRNPKDGLWDVPL